MSKKAIFITTKNLDYLRNVQEIELLKEQYEVTIIGSYHKSYIRRLMKVYTKLLFLPVKEVDKIFIGFAPQLVLPFWKWKLKKQYITIDFFISMYDTLVFDRKKVKKDTFVARVLKKIDEITIHSADHIIVDTREHGNYFVDEFHADKTKIEVLYLNADQSIYYPGKAVKPEAYQGKFVVLYFGSVLPLQGVDIILKAVELLKDCSDIHFEIIGPVPEGSRNKDNKNVTYIPWLAQEKLAEHIAYSDLCLAGHFDNQIMKAKRTIPGKAYIYKAMEKDMVLGDNPANHELHKESDKGIYFVPMGNPEKLSETIYKIKEVKEPADKE